jgi:hypothetical protein
MANPLVDLTTLATVRGYLRLAAETMTSEETATLERLITEKSQQATEIAGKWFVARTYTAETYDGNGLSRLFLRNSPAISLSALTVDGVAVTARATVTGTGYVLGTDRIDLAGSVFTVGTKNVSVTYRAGYEISPWSIPPDVEGAVVNLVALAWKGMDRIGQSYKVEGGQVVDYRGSTEFADAMRALKMHREVWP